MANLPDTIIRDRTALAEWIRHNPTGSVDGSGYQLAGVDLSALNLVNADFSRAVLKESNFRGADLRSSRFESAILENANLDRVNLSHAILVNAIFNGASLRGRVTITRALCHAVKLRQAIAPQADLEAADLTSAELHEADLRGANLSAATLTGANLSGCDLRGANLSAAELTNTAWQGAKIDSGTRFAGTVWRPKHDSPNDGADQLHLPSGRRVLSWATIRIVGRLPLFAGSYVLLTFSLFSATAINWLNDSRVLQTVHYPVPLPPRLIALLIGSTLLAVGSTAFELFCPPRVKEFSRTRWVEELHRPGMLYVSDSLQKPAATVIAFLTIGAGGVLVGWVFVDRLAHALAIVVRALF